MLPNSEQIGALIRHLLTAAGAGFVAKGAIDQSTLTIIVSLAVVVGSSAYDIYLKRQNGIISSAAKMPEVEKIEVKNSNVANNIPSTKVVSK